MPFIQDYNIYCDESFTKRGSIAFNLGALICTPRRAEILATRLDECRSQLARRGHELHFSATSSHDVSVALDFIRVFFEDAFATFVRMSVTKGLRWREWGKNEEERFFKTYWYFLMQITGPHSRYRVFADERPNRWSSRWDSMKFLLNRARRREWGLTRKNVSMLKPVDSADYDLVQLADLLLGAATSASHAAPKQQLIEFVEQHSAMRTKSKKPKIRIINFAPYAAPRIG